MSVDKYRAMVAGESQLRYYLELKDRMDKSDFMLELDLLQTKLEYKVSNLNASIYFKQLNLLLVIMSNGLEMRIYSSDPDLYDNGDTSKTFMTEDRVRYYLQKVANIHKTMLFTSGNPITEINNLNLP